MRQTGDTWRLRRDTEMKERRREREREGEIYRQRGREMRVDGEED